MTVNIQNVIEIWLEEIPVDELTSSTTKMIVNDYRREMIDFEHAVASLKEYCTKELSDWVVENYAINQRLN